MLVDVVPDVPFVAAGNTAFMAPDEAQIIEELVHVELNRLGEPKVGSVEPHVVSEVVERGNQRVIVVRQALRRVSADQMVVKQHIPIGTSSADVELGRIP